MLDLKIKSFTLLRTRDIHFGRNKDNARLNSSGTDPEGLWSYITQGLNIANRTDHDLARRLFELGCFQLTASCNNLKDEYESASNDYSEAVKGLTFEKTRQIEETATKAVQVCGRVANIDEAVLIKVGQDESPPVHLAISYRVRALRAERQMAIQTPYDFHIDYTELRKQLKARPPIDEVEQEFPYFWQKLRTTFAQ